MYVHLRRGEAWICKSIGDHRSPVIVRGDWQGGSRSCSLSDWSALDSRYWPCVFKTLFCLKWVCSEFTHPDSKYISAGQFSVCQCAPHCSRVLINTGERQLFVQILLWSAWRRCNYFSLFPHCLKGDSEDFMSRLPQVEAQYKIK